MSKEIKNWFVQNWLVVVTSLLMVGTNYGILTKTVESKVDVNAAREIAVKEINERVMPVMQRQEVEIEKLQQKVDEALRQNAEFRFNLKRLCEKQGVTYIPNKD